MIESNLDVPVILGINKRYYPKQGDFMGTHDENPPPTLCVLVAGEVGDYAAYVGHSENPEWVARHGDKICFEEACVHFPSGLKRELYRD